MKYKCKKCGNEFNVTFEVRCPKCGATDWNCEPLYKYVHPHPEASDIPASRE